MRLTVKRALVTGLLVSLWLIAGFSILKSLSLPIRQSNLRSLTGLLGLVILFTGVIYGMSRAKASWKGDIFSYSRAVRTGITISVIVAIIVSLASLLYVAVINPHFTDDMVREAELSLKNSGAGAAEINEKLRSVKTEFSLAGQVISPLIVQTVAGTVFSLVLGIFYRTKNTKK